MYLLDDKVRARLLRHMRVTELGCWEWTGVTARNGYGSMQIKDDGKWVTARVHRVAYGIFIGPVPEGRNVLHSCDIRRCFNPSHLRIGTQSENIRDMDIRGRRITTGFARGMRSGNAKLTDDMVRQIRATYTGRYGELAAIARQLGVSTSAIRRAALKGWQHVNGTGETLLLEPPRPKARGAGHSQARLTEAQVLEIRARVASGERQRALAAEYGMSTTMLSLIVNRKAWTHI